MNYFLFLFNVKTFELFMETNKSIVGVKKKLYQSAAKTVRIGDRFICYMSGTSRWFGMLEVQSECFEDSNINVFFKNDPFNLLFKIKPLVLLDMKHSIPISADEIIDSYFGSNKMNPNAPNWWQNLKVLDENDGKFIDAILLKQNADMKEFSYNENTVIKCREYYENEYGLNILEEVINDEDFIDTTKTITEPEEIKTTRHLEYQNKLCKLGEILGFKIWIHPNERNRVLSLNSVNPKAFLDELPINTSKQVLNIISWIDVIWILDNYIVRAFEIEDTTDIRTGATRLGNLISLQPNIDLDAHIVVPAERQLKVVETILQPLFQYLKKPLSDICTVLSYEKIDEIFKLPYLDEYKNTIVDRFVIIADPDFKEK